MEIACIPEKVDIIRELFNNQNVEVCDSTHNPCIDPSIMETNETDNRKLAKKLKKHFPRLLLAWWKAMHYVFSPETRLFYKRTLLQLIFGRNKLYQWPSFVEAVHIDASNVSSRKDSPRIWFEYKAGYDFLAETEANNKATVTVQSFSTSSAQAQTPASKRRKQGYQAEINDATPMPVSRPQLSGTSNRNANRGWSSMADNPNGDEAIARTLYDTPADVRRRGDANLIDQFINTQGNTMGDDTEREMLVQVTASGRRLGPPDPRVLDEDEWVEQL